MVECVAVVAMRLTPLTLVLVPLTLLLTDDTNPLSPTAF